MNNTINYSSDVTRKLTKGYGSASQPIYVDSNGEIQLANNIQASGGDFLPLTGGTVTGDTTIETALTIGKKTLETAPASLTSVNRIILNPPYHTGGPWYLKTEDDSGSAYIGVYYNTNLRFRMKHDGTFSFSGGGAIGGGLTINGGMNWPAPQNITCTCTANGHEWSIDLNAGSYTGTYWHVWSTKNGASILQCYTDNRHVAIPVHLYVGGYNNTSYSLSTASFICNSWIRTTGNTGWYNESYGGGWYMVDSTYIRNYNSKHLYITGRLGVDCELRLWSNTRQITRDGQSVTWVNGRNSALLKETSAPGWHAVVSVKTGSGSWEMGEYNTSGWANYLVFSYVTDTNFNNGTNSSTTIRFRNNGVVESAMWNDYAECRSTEKVEPGRVVQENENKIMKLCNTRLAPGCKIVSDTFGFLIGSKKNCDTPIAVSGRVLVYPYKNKNKYKLGAPVCSAPNGTVDIMTRQEAIMYPERILGTVSEIPDYEIWEGGGVLSHAGTPIKVNGRIWVYVR